MKNYAEDLAYWYFRFNGFFLLNNYVTHPDDRNDNSHSDSDLLAIRIGLPFEKVGLSFRESEREGVAPSDELENKIKTICSKEEKGYNGLIGIICEVKAGQNIKVTNQNLDAQLMRFGFVEELAEAKGSILEKGYYLSKGKYLILRFLASSEGGGF